MDFDFSALSSQTVPALWEQREAIFKQEEFDLDLTQTIDSAGIAFLVQWAKHLESQKLTLRHSTHAVRSLIRTFKLEELFTLVDNR